MASKKKKKVSKTTSAKQITEGRVYINATFNNTIVTITDRKGKPVMWSSCGRMGFSGTRKSTPYAATTTLDAVIKDAMDRGLRRVSLFIRGPGPGRDSALKVLGSKRGLEITSISDVTPIPHNGPRPPKRRRG